MDAFEIASRHRQSIAAEIRDTLLEPFIGAVRATLSEMANTNVDVTAVFRTKLDHALGDTSVEVGLQSVTKGILVLSFPEQTAAALVRRVLAGAVAEFDEATIRDCLGEIANVVAGQAKALLADTPYRFDMSLPTVLNAAEFERRLGHEIDCLLVGFSSELGQFAMQVVLDL